MLLDDTESMRKISALQKRLEQEVIAGSQKLFVSPMLRCRQTAELLFPGQEQVVIDKLREMDFGRSAVSENLNTEIIRNSMGIQIIRHG